VKIAAIFVVTAALLCGTSAAATDAPLVQLLDRASAYVCGYVREFSTVVAEERYVQDSRPMARIDAQGAAVAASQHAELKSDLLFVKPESLESWLTFRDVYAVTGRPVRDREERMAKLFVNERPGALDRARAIAEEGYRYNVGLKERTVANPLIALAFLQPQYRERFEFRLSGIDTSLGPDVWIVKFKERARPTILRTPDNRNVPAMGRFWIDGASGRVMQTELETSTGDKVMTIFAYDERLQLDVPVEMRDIAWLNGTAITGAASYTNFRRFGVVTDENFR
jgi:hypothetical protein